MQVLKQNVMIKSLHKTNHKLWRELVKKQTEIAMHRHENEDLMQLYEQILIPIEQNVHNLTDAGRDEICYAALELARRLNEVRFSNKSILTEMHEDITKLYTECLLHTGEHRELRTQKDKDNYERQLKYKGQLELLEQLLKL